MNRFKKIIFILIFILIINTTSYALGSDFKFYLDVFGHWAQDTIMWASNEVNLFVGYVDGTFKPDEKIKVSEYITILYRVGKSQGIITNNEEYKDITYYEDLDKSFWGYDEIKNVINYIDSTSNDISFRNIFKGKKLEHNRPITREEAMILTSFFNTIAVEDKGIKFKDISGSYKYYDELYNLVNNGIIEGYEDNTFKPSRNISRAEAATIIKRVYHDMEYFKNEYLMDIQLIDPPQYTKYLAFGDYKDIKLKDEDHLFRRAVATLEYKSIIDFTYLYDNYLYDSNPIKTLESLKDTNYWNIAGVNYYLLTHGNIGENKKVDMYKELLENYLIRDDIDDEESLTLLQLGFEILEDREDLLKGIDKWESIAASQDDKYNAIFLKSKVSLLNKDMKKALEPYENIMKEKELLTNKVLKHIIINRAYILLEFNKFDESEKVIREGLKLLNNTNYNDEFKGALKEILNKRASYNLLNQ